MTVNNVKRCAWPGNDPDFMIEYHDREWGVPLYDDNKLFEFLVLDAFQAGLSWRTVLAKRNNFARAFDKFDAKRIALYTKKDVTRLMRDPGIIRNRLKIEGTVKNAKAYLKTVEREGSFNAYVWRFVDGKPRVNKWKKISQLPASTRESDAMSKDLKARGFTFVGSTICYAFMQAAGMVNDHTVDCFRYKEVQNLIN